jgi:hypothetical protein
MISLKKQFLSGLSRAELEALLERQLAERAALQQQEAVLRRELVRLKSGGKQPAANPNAMEVTGSEPAGAGGRRRRKHGRPADD